MSELFDIPETKSPRLLWMEKHGIEITRITDDALGDFRFVASKTICEAGLNEDDAIAKMAERLEIRLWNEL